MFSDAVLGSNVTLFLNVANGVPPYTWRLASGSTLPPGLQLVNANAASTSFLPATTVIAGIPTTAGAYSFDLIATDAVGAEVRRTFTLNVTRIALINGPLPTAITGTAYNVRFVAVGGTGSYTFTTTPTSGQDMLPPGFAVTAAGQLAGTTTSTGSYTFNLRVQDTAGNTLNRTFTLTVNNSLGLRVLSGNPADLWVGGGLNGELDLDVNGSSTYTWTHTGGTLPPGLHLVTDIGGPNNTELVGAPTTPGILHLHAARDRQRQCGELCRACLYGSCRTDADRFAADRAPGGSDHRLAVGPCWRAVLVHAQGRWRNTALHVCAISVASTAGRLYLELWPASCPARHR